MKKDTEYFKFFSIGFICLLVTYLLPFDFIAKISSELNDLSAWYSYNFSKKSLKQLKFIGIAADDYTLSNIRQRWPFKRSVYAELLQILDKEKANTVGFDILFEADSEDREYDRIFSETLGSITLRTVLAYRFDPKEKKPIISKFAEKSFATGMINTPADKAGKIHRLRAYVGIQDNLYYSFSVALASTYLNQSPQKTVSYIPLLKDRTYAINYLVTPQDIINLSLYDVLENLPELKQKYGDDFFKDSLVLVYPEAEIIHDIYLTPLGRMPGGFLHLNGVADIILRHFLEESIALHILFLIAALAIIAYSLNYWGVISGFIITSGMLLFDFWLSVLFSLKGIKLDYSRIVIFGLSFFIIGSLYKYIYFLAKLLKIKNKATFDPLRNISTLRYFYYRLKLEQEKYLYKNRYWRKNLFLAYLYLESFQKISETMSLDGLRTLWQGISGALLLKDSLWSTYSEEELAGYIIGQPDKIGSTAQSLRNNLEALLQENGVKLKVRLAYLKIKKDSPVRESLVILSKELKKRNAEILFLQDKDLESNPLPSYLKIKEPDSFLESLEEDIEEKNRQLLILVENLNKEHLKTKEAFFQIITSLVNALEARDPYTQGHSDRVCSYALRMAERLGWNQEEKEKLRKAALLHDIGKIGIHDNILHKPGQLTDEEYDVIKKHEIIGVKILEPLKEFQEILPWILYHHERWDGKGYPHGLAGEAIPVGARIISLSDVFDAMVTGRDYKKAFSSEEAREEISKNKGTQFDPHLTDIFVDVVIKR